MFLLNRQNIRQRPVLMMAGTFNDDIFPLIQGKWNAHNTNDINRIRQWLSGAHWPNCESASCGVSCMMT